MKFANPSFLYAIPVVWALLGAVLWAGRNRRRRLLERFAGQQASGWAVADDHPRMRQVHHALGFAVVGLALAALARPLYFSPDDKSELQGAPYIVALDVSRSMLANDIKPSRYSAATNALDRLFAEPQADRIGLITFSGVAYLNAPLTFDTAALRTILSYVNPYAMMDPGSSLGGALDRAARYFTSNAVPKRAVVLISDGEDLDPKTLSVARKLHRDHGLVIHTIGVGTSVGAQVAVARAPVVTNGIPTPPRTILTKLDEINLQRIANAAGGRYFRLGSDGDGLRRLRAEVLKPLAEEAARNDLQNYVDCFWIPLGLALVMLVVQLLVGADRRTRRRTLPSILQPTP